MASLFWIMCLLFAAFSALLALGVFVVVVIAIAAGVNDAVVSAGKTAKNALSDKHVQKGLVEGFFTLLSGN